MPKWELKQNIPCVGMLAIQSGEDTDCLELDTHYNVQFPDRGWQFRDSTHF
jgi:hypothetical protein